MAMASRDNDRQTICFFWQLISDKLIGALVPDSLRIYCMGFIFFPHSGQGCFSFSDSISIPCDCIFSLNLRGWEGSFGWDDCLELEVAKLIIWGPRVP